MKSRTTHDPSQADVIREVIATYLSPPGRTHPTPTAWNRADGLLRRLEAEGLRVGPVSLRWGCDTALLDAVGSISPTVNLWMDPNNGSLAAISATGSDYQTTRLLMDLLIRVKQPQQEMSA